MKILFIILFIFICCGCTDRLIEGKIQELQMQVSLLEVFNRHQNIRIQELDKRIICLEKQLETIPKWK